MTSGENLFAPESSVINSTTITRLAFAVSAAKAGNEALAEAADVAAGLPSFRSVLHANVMIRSGVAVIVGAICLMA